MTTSPAHHTFLLTWPSLRPPCAAQAAEIGVPQAEDDDRVGSRLATLIDIQVRLWCGVVWCGVVWCARWLA